MEITLLHCPLLIYLMEIPLLQQTGPLLIYPKWRLHYYTTLCLFNLDGS